MMTEKQKKPPTKRQLERVKEYIDHPAIQPHLDRLMGTIETHLKTVGGTGVLIGWMKEEINEYNKRHVLGADVYGNRYSPGISFITSA